MLSRSPCTQISRHGFAFIVAYGVLHGPGIGHAQDGYQARLGYNPAWASTALNVGVSQGYFSKAGVKVIPRVFNNPADIVQAIASGDLDAGVSTAGVMFTAVQRGVKIKAVAVAEGIQNPPIAYMVRVDSGINQIGDLRGKTAGVGGYGGNVDLFLRYWLDKHGLNPKTDLKIVFVPFQLTVSALINRQIQIGGVDAVADLIARKQYPGQLKSLFNFVDVTEDGFNGKNENSLLLVFSNRFSEEHHETALKFMEGYLAAIKAVQRDPKSALNDWAEATKIPEIRELKEPDILPTDGKVYLDALQFEAGLAYKFGYLTAPIDVHATVDNRLIEDAAARIK
jgi:ABC-type nitrate/sulfonate/bicarbonate transport system substrate-binding protein